MHFLGHMRRALAAVRQRLPFIQGHMYSATSLSWTLFRKPNAEAVSAMISSLRISGFLPSKEPTSKQDLVQYANRVTGARGNQMTYNDAEAINGMQVVGMKEFRAVTAFSIPPHMLGAKLKSVLKSKKIPDPAIEAIVNAVEFTPRYSDSFEDFEVDPDGSAYIFKVTAMIKPSSEFDNHSDVALAVSGASFNAAKVVDHYHEEVIPQHKLVSVPQDIWVNGFFDNYKKTVFVDEYITLGCVVKKTPVFKEKVITPAKLESIKHFLEAKTLGEVKLLYGPHDKTALEDKWAPDALGPTFATSSGFRFVRKRSLQHV